MTDNNRGFMVTLGFGLNNSGHLQLMQSSAAPVAPPPAATAWEVPNDGHSDLAMLAIASVGAAGAGMLIRGLKKEKILSPKDIALDAAVGLQVGTCLVGTPQAESICYGAIGTLPLQIIDRLQDPKWDFRIGMLTTGALSLGRAEVGGNPIPFAGYRTNAAGAVTANAPELIANASVDVAEDAAFYALSNTSAALLQGYQLQALLPLAISGAAYGGAQSVVVNTSFGAPLRLSDNLKAGAIAIDKKNGGPDVSNVIRFTTFRAGGILEQLTPGSAVTLGRDVQLQFSDMGPDTVGHELIHRTQMAGSQAQGRDGTGLFSFYTQYGAWAYKGYDNIPYEREAYHYAETYKEAPYSEGAQVGDFLAAPVALGMFALPAVLMPPDKK